MKIPFSEYQRRGIVPLAGLVLAVYYLFAVLPLARQAEGFDEPLQKAWQKLSVSLGHTNTTAIDFLRITNQLSETRQAMLILENAKKQATARLQLSAAVRAKMRADFQLVEFENERSKQQEELSNLAKQKQVVVEPAVFSNFPGHTADVKQPALLWAALALTDSLLHTALQCRVVAVHSLEVPPVLANVPPPYEQERLTEIPLQVEFTASAASAARLLQCLPLRAEEIRAAGLLETPGDKPVLFVDRLLIQKQSADKPDEVHVWLRALGFVLRE
ncbi:MAG: hypothetical protein NT154_30895 [Verrucomicrobia bacterium]|nr:hypothetical protein [Verrucomicrobiota bacterium]